MSPTSILLLSILIYLAAALAALLIKGSDRLARQAPALLGLAASILGVIAAASSMLGVQPQIQVIYSAPPFGQFALNLDALSAFMVGLICLVGIATSIYAFSNEESPASMEFFTNLFMAAMLLVVSVDNALYFLVFWELMTLASYFLVTWKSEDKANVVTGYVYMVVAHAGAVLIMLAFFLMFRRAGGFDFALMQAAVMSPRLRAVVFLLAFIGFGAKAGMVPLHFWTPATYAAAPSHVSALMSGVMKKTAIYGILRVCIDILGAQQMWWGLLVLLIGALSTVAGAFYALTEKDIKRLLAYSSVENVGIILLGVGLGMTAVAVQQPALAGLAIAAALYHMLNHGFFKSLLFLASGSVIDQVRTTNLTRMGGLARRMPLTGLFFLVGVLAVSAIPPLNGFVSEWFTYHALFAASLTPRFELRVFSPVFAIMLALAGAIAAMVYVKAYSSVFSGPSRSPAVSTAQEAPQTKLFSMAYLALVCLGLGIAAPVVAPWLSGITARFLGEEPLLVTVGLRVFPGSPAQAVVSTPLVAILLLGLLLVPVLLIAVFGKSKIKRRENVDPWTCGYGYSTRMSMPAPSYDQPVKVSFSPIFWLRTFLHPVYARIVSFTAPVLAEIRRLEPMIENAVTRPTQRLVETGGQWIQALQMGDIRVYCLYIILTLAILLIAVFGGIGL